MANHRFPLLSTATIVLALLISQQILPNPLLGHSAQNTVSQVRIKVAPPSCSPVKTFQVTPPASFGADQLPDHGLIEFNVSGTAGQTLRVQLSNTNLFLKALQHKAGDTRLPSAGDSGNRLYVLPRTGVYRFLLDPGRDKTSIRFDFLTRNNPMIDPGIDQRRFSVHFGAFAKEARITVIPYTLNEEEDYLNSWPAHLGLEKRQFRV